MLPLRLEHPAPNVWHQLNLRCNPYFHEALDPRPASRYPLDLFVGRDAEVARYVNGVLGAASSRQVIIGRRGVGKTTLAQKVKQTAAVEGYAVSWDAVNVGHADTTDVLALRILNGAGAIFTIVVPDLLREIRDAGARLLGVQGILLHLNNLENLADSDAAQAAAALTDLRHSCLMATGYHWMLVGRQDAVRGIMRQAPAVAGVFSPLQSLGSMTRVNVEAMLRRRLSFLRVDPSQAPHALDASLVGERWSSCRGDLHALLKGFEGAQ